MFFSQNMVEEESDSFDPNSIVEPQLSQPPLLTSNAIYPFQDDTPNVTNPAAQDLSSSSSSAMEIQLQLHNHNQNQNPNHLLSFDSSLPDSSFTPTPDLLSLYHFPKSSTAASFLPLSFPNAPHLSFAGEIPMVDAASVCDPLLYLNLPPQPHLVRDLFQSLPPNGYTVFGDEQIESNGGGVYGGYSGEEPAENGVTEFSFKTGKRRKGGKGTKQFVNDRERRVQVKDTYEVLKNLVPKPSKDRASIVADAIKYIKELVSSVNYLKMLVEKKRCAKERNKKRLKTEEDSTENGLESSCITKPGLNIADSTTDQASFNNGSLRSSWVQRKSKDTEVDVRIIDDEVTIKLVQRKRMNRLLYVSKILDELQLDLHHVAGGDVGDYYSFLFNTKINEGCCVYASGIANRIMEMAEGPHASTPSTSCY